MKKVTMETDRLGNKFWRLPNGDLHREDGPAVIYITGTKGWFIDGQLNRTDGPAVEYFNGDKEWYINDLLHRQDGPAVEYKNGDKKWFVYNEQYTEEEFNI